MQIKSKFIFLLLVKRTADGYVYEWAYSKRSIYPLELNAGSRFRLSVFPLDRDKPGPLGGIQFGGFNANVDARPEKWREFTLTD
ncbi:MAG: hypothetical protein HY646_15130 [Acidobacteria bacterium]|nr:hypothetical protein [Acidobacteriota bacterium]